jgi:cytidylate kinase
MGEGITLGGKVQVIAIDGPVAAGKTVVGLKLAQRLGFQFVDTGVMYRAITWLALELEIPVDDAPALTELARQTPIELRGPDSSQVTAGGRRLGPELRETRVEQSVSRVSQVPGVRAALVQQQRRRAAAGKLVMVGRDIGTVVLPDADLKVFMSASAAERARRRWWEMINRGRQVEYEQVLREIEERDRLDSQRAQSPLAMAADAQLLNTDDVAVDQVVEAILAMVQARCRQAG